MNGRGKEKLNTKSCSNSIIKDSNPTYDGSSSASPPPPPPWIELPRELMENILSRLGPVEILETAQKVCTTWRSVCTQPSMWRVIDTKDMYLNSRMFRDQNIICRRLIDLSQGELIDINIVNFGNDDLLLYISQRSSHLKCLRLQFCHGISVDGLITSVRNLPELEELHLEFMHNITAEEDIEGIIECCPKLKSFTFNVRSYMLASLNINDNCPLSIARNLPNLQHLSLIGNNLNNEVLKAIFNGCPLLESLDLRKCCNVDLQGDFGKICLERIKYMKCPSDSIDDYNFGMIYGHEDSWYDSSDYESIGGYDYCDDDYDHCRRSI